MKLVRCLCILLFTVTFIRPQQVFGQEPTEVFCGESYELEFSSAHQKLQFSISLKAGDVLSVEGNAFGDTMGFYIAGWDPDNNLVLPSSGGKSPSTKTPILSASGRYIVNAYEPNSRGSFILKFKCNTPRPNKGITATSTPSSAAKGSSTSPTATTQPSPQTTFTGKGFPGLLPVSFEEVESTEIELGKPEQAIINAKNNDIIGFTFTGKISDTLDLTFARKAGNLNLGLVVLSADNLVVFQTSLVTSSALNTRLTLPSAGQYTIGVFKIGLIPPKQPTATKFEITAKLNP